MLEILLIGDSLSMVRPDHGVRFEDTYAYLLQNRLKDCIIFNASQRANSSQNVLSSNYCYETFDAINPDLIIYFLGIVDCMPRLFTSAQRLLLRLIMASRYFRGIGRLIISYRSKRRYALTKKRLIQFVPIEDWNKNVEILLKKKSKVIFVNIPFPGDRLLTRNHGIVDIIDNYNASLLSLSKKYGGTVIDFNSITKQAPVLLLEDGYHITAEAHKVLSNLLIDEIKKMTQTNNIRNQAK